MSRRAMLAIFLAGMLSWTLAAPVDAAPRAFVSVSGDDGNSDPTTPEFSTLNPKTDCGPVSPCRTIAKALSVLDAGGEVVLVSSGDYEPFSITGGRIKSVAVGAAPGVHAVITAMSGNAVTIETLSNRVAITLRGLNLNGRGGQTGIDASGDIVLHVEDCVLDGFTGNAVAFSGDQLHVRDTAVRNSGSDYASAIYIQFAYIVSIDRLRMDHNRHGLVVDTGQMVTIRDSVAARQIDHAMWARGLTGAVDLTIENCTITGTQLGSAVIAGDPAGPHAGPMRISISHSTVTSNQTGISAYPTDNDVWRSSVWVSDTTIAMNDKGVVQSGAASILSRGNNTLEANGENNGFLPPCDSSVSPPRCAFSAK